MGLKVEGGGGAQQLTCQNYRRWEKIKLNFLDENNPESIISGEKYSSVEIFWTEIDMLWNGFGQLLLYVKYCKDEMLEIYWV